MRRRSPKRGPFTSFSPTEEATSGTCQTPPASQQARRHEATAKQGMLMPVLKPHITPKDHA